MVLPNCVSHACGAVFAVAATCGLVWFGLHAYYQDRMTTWLGFAATCALFAMCTTWLILVWFQQAESRGVSPCCCSTGESKAKVVPRQPVSAPSATSGRGRIGLAGPTDQMHSPQEASSSSISTISNLSTDLAGEIELLNGRQQPVRVQWQGASPGAAFGWANASNLHASRYRTRTGESYPGQSVHAPSNGSLNAVAASSVSVAASAPRQAPASGDATTVNDRRTGGAYAPARVSGGGSPQPQHRKDQDQGRRIAQPADPRSPTSSTQTSLSSAASVWANSIEEQGDPRKDRAAGRSPCPPVPLPALPSVDGRSKKEQDQREGGATGRNSVSGRAGDEVQRTSVHRVQIQVRRAARDRDGRRLGVPARVRAAFARRFVDEAAVWGQEVPRGGGQMAGSSLEECAICLEGYGAGCSACEHNHESHGCSADAASGGAAGTGIANEIRDDDGGAQASAVSHGSGGKQSQNADNGASRKYTHSQSGQSLTSEGGALFEWRIRSLLQTSRRIRNYVWQRRAYEKHVIRRRKQQQNGSLQASVDESLAGAMGMMSPGSLEGCEWLHTVSEQAVEVVAAIRGALLEHSGHMAGGVQLHSEAAGAGGDYASEGRQSLAGALSHLQLYPPFARGGIGKMVLGQDKGTGQVLALKVMSRKAMDKQKMRGRVLQEQRLASLLASDGMPCFVQMHKFVRSRNAAVMAMSFMPGGDLYSLLAGVGRLSEDKAAPLVAMMLLCVRAMHRLGVAHRDLKPDNFVIDRRGHLRVIDFGLAADELEMLGQRTKHQPRSVRERESKLEEQRKKDEKKQRYKQAKQTLKHLQQGQGQGQAAAGDAAEAAGAFLQDALPPPPSSTSSRGGDASDTTPTGLLGTQPPSEVHPEGSKRRIKSGTLASGGPSSGAGAGKQDAPVTGGLQLLEGGDPESKRRSDRRGRGRGDEGVGASALGLDQEQGIRRGGDERRSDTGLGVGARGYGLLGSGLASDSSKGRAAARRAIRVVQPMPKLDGQGTTMMLQAESRRLVRLKGQTAPGTGSSSSSPDSGGTSAGVMVSAGTRNDAESRPAVVGVLPGQVDPTMGGAPRNPGGRPPASRGSVSDRQREHFQRPALVVTSTSVGPDSSGLQVPAGDSGGNADRVHSRVHSVRDGDGDERDEDGRTTAVGQPGMLQTGQFSTVREEDVDLLMRGRRSGAHSGSASGSGTKSSTSSEGRRGRRGHAAGGAGSSGEAPSSPVAAGAVPSPSGLQSLRPAGLQVDTAGAMRHAGVEPQPVLQMQHEVEQPMGAGQGRALGQASAPGGVQTAGGKATTSPAAVARREGFSNERAAAEGQGAAGGGIRMRQRLVDRGQRARVKMRRRSSPGPNTPSIGQGKFQGVRGAAHGGVADAEATAGAADADHGKEMSTSAWARQGGMLGDTNYKNDPENGAGQTGESSGRMASLPTPKRPPVPPPFLRYSQVGTRSYLAPETIEGEGHGYACDYWSVGVILFESLLGYLPFTDRRSTQVTFRNILAGRIRWPRRQSSWPSEDAVDLIEGLLHVDPDERYGAGGGGGTGDEAGEVSDQRWKDLQQHPYFVNNGVDWSRLYVEDGPFVPQPSGELDTGYFEAPSRPISSIDYQERQKSDNGLTVDFSKGRGGKSRGADDPMPALHGAVDAASSDHSAAPRPAVLHTLAGGPEASADVTLHSGKGGGSTGTTANKSKQTSAGVHMHVQVGDEGRSDSGGSVGVDGAESGDDEDLGGRGRLGGATTALGRVAQQRGRKGKGKGKDKDNGRYKDRLYAGKADGGLRQAAAASRKGQGKGKGKGKGRGDLEDSSWGGDDSGLSGSGLSEGPWRIAQAMQRNQDRKSGKRTRS